MPQITEYEKRKEFYEKIANDKNAKKNPVYKKLVDALKALNTATSEYYTEDTNKNFKPMTTAAYDAVMKAYKDARQASESFARYAENEKADKFSKDRAFIAKELNKIISKDLTSLLAADRANPGPLHGIVREARSVKVSLNGELSKVGDALSSRIPIKSKDGSMKGFFTKETVFKKDDSWNAFRKEKISELPEELKQLFGSCSFAVFNETARNKISKLKKAIDLDIKDNDSKKEGKEYGITLACADIAADLEGSYSYKSKWETAFEDNPNLRQEFIKTVNEALRATSAARLFVEYGIQNGTNLAGRNVAMSNVARLIGCSDVLAKSFHMTVENNGRKEEGVFMENADGTNIRTVAPDDEFYTYGKEVYENPNALKQLADLQILDFICGNADRHMGNLMFKFGKDENGKTILQSIKGIDNDCSFGAIKKAEGKMTNINAIKVIDEKTAEMINTLDPQMLMAVIGPDITTAAEKEAAEARLEKIKDGIKSKQIKVVTAEEWGHQKLDNLAPSAYEGFNIFSRVKATVENNLKMTDAQKQESRTISEIKFNDANEIPQEKKKWDIGTEFNNVASLVEKMKAADKFYIGSKEFCAMRDGLYELNDKITGLKEGTLKDEEKTELYSLAAKLTSRTREYIVKKDITQSTGHGRERMALARDIEALGEHLSEEVLAEFEPVKESEEEMSM